MFLDSYQQGDQSAAWGRRSRAAAQPFTAASKAAASGSSREEASALQRLELGGSPLPLRMAEVVVLGSASYDWRVVGEPLVAVWCAQVKLATVEVESDDLAQDNPDIPLPLKKTALSG